MILPIFKKKKYIENVNTAEDAAKYLGFKNREIKLDTITPLVANNLDTLIRYWNIEDEELNKTFAEREPIKIYINSLGGSLEGTLTIINSIMMSRTPVYTFNIGVVEKEAFLIYIAGHKRLSYANAIFMFSDSILIKEEQEKSSNESNFYNQISLVNSVAKDMKLLFLDRVGITEAQYDKHCKNDWWFNAEDALKLHICNEISRKHFHYVKKEDLRA